MGPWLTRHDFIWKIWNFRVIQPAWPKFNSDREGSWGIIPLGKFFFIQSSKEQSTCPTWAPPLVISKVIDPINGLMNENMELFSPYCTYGGYDSTYSWFLPSPTPPNSSCFISKSPPANNTALLRKYLEHMQQVSPATPWPQPKLSWRSEPSLRSLRFPSTHSQENPSESASWKAHEKRGICKMNKWFNLPPQKNGPLQMGKIWLCPYLVWCFVEKPRQDKYLHQIGSSWIQGKVE